MKPNHAHIMKRALSLARRGLGRVNPNPMVGCVLVKGGRIIAEGFHPYYGGPHAEVVALKKAGKAARGATMYVTLEPCAHWGKTPPCLPLIAQSGIKEIFISLRDPNPLVSGRSIKALKAAGLKVHVGLEERAATELNTAFMTAMTQKRPYCVLKMAQSLDGKSATRTGDSRWISGPASRRQVHRWRAQSDAVLVGANTALHDNPLLTSHGMGKNPLRVVLDPHLKTPSTLKLYTDRSAKTLLVVSNQVPERRLIPYRKRGVQILRNRLKYGSFDLKHILNYMFKNNVNQLLIEGGQTTANAFIQQNLIDEALFFVAPILIGGKDKIKKATALKSWTVTRSGTDLLVRGRVK